MQRRRSPLSRSDGNWHDYLTRPHRRFATAPNGPLVVQAHEGGVTVTDSRGDVLTLPVNSVLDQRVDRERLRAGVEFHWNGEPAGRLVQRGRGRRRSARTLDVHGSEHDRYPDGTRFRLRRWYSVSLESAGERLVDCWPFTRRIRVSDRAGPELTALFAAVDHGFREPLRQATAWLPPTLEEST